MFNTLPSPELRRGDRVDDCAALEMLCTRKGTQGSNPCLSAIISNSPSPNFA